MRKAVVFIALLLCTLQLRAGDPQKQTNEEKELQDLLSIVNEETAVATKTRINSDYVPGIVTVLEGDELEALGVRTASEALGLVPGIQSIRDPRTTDLVIVRGLDFPFNSGNIQVLVNSIPLARQDAGFNTSALQIPVEQIDRIEFIRGPGSVIYGDFAFMGLVNIITRTEGSRVHLRGDDNGAISGGARAVLGTASSPWHLSASLAGTHEAHAAAVAPREVRGDGHSAI